MGIGRWRVTYSAYDLPAEPYSKLGTGEKSETAKQQWQQSPADRFVVIGLISQCVDAGSDQAYRNPPVSVPALRQLGGRHQSRLQFLEAKARDKRTEPLTGAPPISLALLGQGAVETFGTTIANLLAAFGTYEA